MKEDIKISSNRHIELEVQRIINKKLFDRKIITQDIYSKANNILLKKISALI